MFLGKVVGTVWSTKKTPDLEGIRFLVVHPYDLEKDPTRNIVIVADRLGAPAYGQLALEADRRLHDEGPEADEMGAYGFLLATHRWKNVGIRMREFAPVGIRVLLIPVT